MRSALKCKIMAVRSDRYRTVVPDSVVILRCEGTILSEMRSLVLHYT